MKREGLWQKARAALSCGTATAVDFATLTVLMQVAELSVLVGAAVGASAGAVVNYFLHRHTVFRATTERKRRQLPRYLVVAATTMVLSAGLTALVADIVGVHYLLARALAAVTVFLLWHEPLARRAFASKGTAPVENFHSTPKAIEIGNDRAGGATMTTKPELSVIIPAYNEQDRIIATLNDVQRIVASRRHIVEVIVVDDGSSDRTVSIIEEMIPSFRKLSLIRCETNGGKGAAVRRGVLASSGDVVLFMDADNSVSLEHVDALLSQLDEGADAAIGSRYADPTKTRRRQPWYRVAWSRLANVFVRLVLLEGIADTQCGFKAFRAAPARRAFSQLTISGWGFDLEVLTVLDRMGYTIAEVPVPFTDDRRTRINPLTDLWAVISDFLRVQRNLALGRYNLTRASLIPG